MHMPGEYYDYSWVFHFWYCSRKGARLAEEERKKEKEDDETGFSPLLGLPLKQRF